MSGSPDPLSSSPRGLRLAALFPSNASLSSPAGRRCCRCLSGTPFLHVFPVELMLLMFFLPLLLGPPKSRLGFRFWFCFFAIYCGLIEVMGFVWFFSRKIGTLIVLRLLLVLGDETYEISALFACSLAV